MIELKGVSKIYRTKKGIKTLALDNISFKLPNKGLFFILGKSGSGKSTLLNILGGLDKYNDGEIIVDGKSTKKFRGKDFDYYRNTYIGFVFQEFNLLDEYDVYDNIILSRKLQKEKISHTVIDDLLNKVGINGLGKRRMNELSGGQKQRVAIARALIKNPEIILADEPTGNLDVETGKQIFSLLKSISKEKLVIVVSHDREAALNYADGIIEISDGKIASNSIQLSLEENRIFKAKKSKLPFTASLKFAFANLGSHKIKLFFTILLIFMSVVFFGTSKILSKFNIEKSHAKTMYEDKTEYITIRKGEYVKAEKRWQNNSHLNFEREDIEAVSKKLNSPYQLEYQLNEGNQAIRLDIDYKTLIKREDLSMYYLYVPSNFYFIEADETFINQKIIGKYPEKYDEVMIHSYLADYIIEAGIMLYEETPNQFKKEYYKPTSYEELLDGKYYTLGSTKVKITGIVIDNTEPFQYLKKVSRHVGMGVSESWLGLPKNDITKGFSELVVSNASYVYVAPHFVENINLKPNTVIDSEHYIVKIKNGESFVFAGAETRILENKLNVFNGEKLVTVEKLNDSEIILPETYLDRISNGEYSKLKEGYIKAYNDEIRNLELENKSIREENKRLEEEYEKNLEINEEVEEPTYKEEKEFVYKDEDELSLEFIKNYIKENVSLDNEISLLFIPREKQEITSNFKIIGFELNGDDIYLSDQAGSKFMRKNYEPKYIIIHEREKSKLENILRTFPEWNSQYMSSTIYSYSIDVIRNFFENISILAKYASYIFGFFAFILLTNFIVNSIYYNKKTIGILRGLGARKRDIFKIFLNEGLIIGAFSLILSIVTLYIGIYWVNNYISSYLFYHIDFVTFTMKNLCIIIGSVIGIIFISSLFTVRKIAKMNPVDAILNK